MKVKYIIVLLCLVTSPDDNDIRQVIHYHYIFDVLFDYLFDFILEIYVTMNIMYCCKSDIIVRFVAMHDWS